MKALFGVVVLVVVAAGPTGSGALAAHSPTLPMAAAHRGNGSFVRGTEVAVQVAVSPTSVPHRSTHPARSRLQFVGASQSTGDGVGTVWGSMNIYLLILGIFLLAVALLFLGRRFAFATTGRRSRDIANELPVPGARVILDPQSTAEMPAVPISHDLQHAAAFSSHDQSSSEAHPLPSEPFSATPDPAQSPDVKPADAEPPERPDWPPRLDLSPPQAARLPSTAPGSGPFATLESLGSVEQSRARALEMARQWSDIVQELVQQLDRQEAERRELLARIAALEQSGRAYESLKGVLAASSGDRLTSDDLRAVQYVVDSLLQDPDHIVVLAAVAQHAQQLARVVTNYARVVRAMGEP